MSQERCYECRGYGDDYYLDENGDLVNACAECPFNGEEGEDDLPSAQPKVAKDTNVPINDCISRQAAIEETWKEPSYTDPINVLTEVRDRIKALPSAQPQRTCVNCGRTANNGGWYADGRTRCPIEEHYALPKDGYCHLWEKRNVTDDDYPERREE